MWGVYEEGESGPILARLILGLPVQGEIVVVHWKKKRPS